MEDYESEGDEVKPFVPPDKGKGIKRMSGDVKQVAFISFAVVAVVLFLMSMAGGILFVTPKDLAGKMTAFDSIVKKAEADLMKAQSSVATAVQDIPKQVSTSVTQHLSSLNSQITSLSGTVSTLNSNIQNTSSSLTAKINEYATKVSDANSQIATLKTQVAALEKKIADYQTRIASLEAKFVANDEDRSSLVTARIKSMTSVMMPSDSNTLIADFRIVLTNTTNAEIEDIILRIVVDTGITQSITSFALTGGGTVWSSYGFDAQQREFVNTQWGLNLDASASKTLYLRLTVVGTGIGTLYPSGAGYNVDVEVD